MYKITEEFAIIIGRMKTSYISEVLGMNLAYISTILNGKKCSQIVAKGILSIYFNIAINDKQMNELIAKYFIKIED